MSYEKNEDIQQCAIQALRDEADKIHNLIKVQLAHLTGPKCPLYEEVVDTQMYGLSKVVDFAIRVGIVTKDEANQIMDRLEVDVNRLHEAISLLSSVGKE